MFLQEIEVTLFLTMLRNDPKYHRRFEPNKWDKISRNYEIIQYRVNNIHNIQVPEDTVEEINYYWINRLFHN